MDSKISIKDLSKSYGDVQALKGINLDIESGELFGLIGPDGAGKTSLFRLLATLLLPDSGSATLCGFDMVKEYKPIRNILGYMPGRFSLYQDLSVLENLNFFATVFDTRIEDNMEMIRDIWLQIEPFKHRLAGKLSGGMKQKLALCCALIHQPKILLLDEPTTGVDVVSRSEFWQMLKSLKAKGVTIIVATPYMDEANLCERVALMQDGEILSLNTPAGIISDFGRDLYAIQGKDIYQLLLDLRTYPHANSVFPFGQSIHYTDKRDAISPSELKDYLISKGQYDIEISKITAGIEDCFMALSQQNKVQA
ncbi:ABC transporter ATP-binding protein [Ancylomarina euxinus]|uniref:ABC transporter ATP-binding protein n=1 Tax=Ancylomarina euxinus TaxID=2283627 RepID=A0A425Y1U8_9BACT|nr:ABC transporter ATP-binding protein [Ancylomarina euxinus]MCZ4695044.1 ABC transporter ATP-binding protein [Ancylomarina euxinus]MUP15020.1 ATP-binding cassette domain-containing protein [Ancylomarina euxinus]RRG21908.1 ABC transporter ATP-binding protein [Ancylomarina euxinus]